MVTFPVTLSLKIHLVFIFVNLYNTLYQGGAFAVAEYERREKRE